MYKTNLKSWGNAIFEHTNLDFSYIEDLSTAVDDDFEIISIKLN